MSAEPVAPAPRPPPRPRRLGRALGLLTLLIIGALAALACYPPAWHAALRALLSSEAAHRGLRLEIGAAEGGPFEGITFQDLHLWSRDPAPPRTDLRARRASVTFARPAVPFFGQPQTSWLERVVLEGVRGDLRVDRPSPPSTAVGEVVPGTPAPFWQAWLPARWRPAVPRRERLAPRRFAVFNEPGETLALFWRTEAEVRLRGLRLTGEPDGPGEFLARDVEAWGRGGLANTFPLWRGTTAWRGARLSVRDVALTAGVDLTHATLDGGRLLRDGRLEGDAAVRALGGELRAQFGAALAGGRDRSLEVAGSLQGVGIWPLAELLGVREPTGGTVRAGQFSFRGDPAAPADATGSLRVDALDCRFGERRWQRLVLAATVVNHRVTIHELELVQRANRLSLHGEGNLPKPGNGWWPTEISGDVDARLDDLKTFGLLLGPAFPPLAGRVQVRGSVAGGGKNGLDGRFGVEGGPLVVRGLPLDRLRAAGRFRNGELEVSDLQAGRAGDTLAGRGSLALGAGRYDAELKVHVKDLAPYGPALPSGWFPEPPRGALTLDWSGDGNAQSHNGAFRARAGGFAAPAGPAALPRAVDVDAEGTYSPDRVSFRRLVFRDNVGKDSPEFHARFEGALPFTQNRAALAAGHLSRPEGALSGRLELRDFDLDLLPPLRPALLAPGTDGRLAGWLDLAGTAREPRLNGALQLRRGRLRWRSPPAGAAGWWNVDGLEADVRLADAALLLDAVRGGPEAGVGEGFTVSGRVDWTDTGTPVTLGLALGCKDAALADSEAARLRGDFEGTVRGAASAPEIAGELRLRENGRVWRELAFATGDDAAFPWPLPAGATLDVRVSALGPLRLETAAGTRGELLPDGRVTGTAGEPVFAGEVALRRIVLAMPAAELAAEAGTLSFNDPARPGDPSVALTAFHALPAARRGAAGRLRVDFFGPLSAGNAVFSAEPPRWSADLVRDFLVSGKPLPEPAPLALPAPAPPGMEPPEPPKLRLRLR